MINDAVDVNVPDIRQILQRFREGQEHLLRQLTAADVAHDRAGLAAIWPEITRKELLMLVIFLEAVIRETGGAETCPDRELDAPDLLLQYEQRMRAALFLSS